MTYNPTSKIKKKGSQVSNPNDRLFGFFSLIIFVFVPMIFVSGTLDGVQPVRLLAIGLFLAIYGGLLYLSGRMKTLPFSVWNNPLIWLMLGYLIITICSIAFALNVKETYFDIAKTLTFFVFTLLLSALLYQTIDWEDKIIRYIVIATCISVIVGVYQFFKFVIGAETGFLPDGRPVIYEIKGLMAHKNQYSINLMLMLPMLVYGAIASKSKLWQRLSLVSMIAAGVMIIILQTRSVWTALLVTTSIMVVFSFFFYSNLGITLKTRKLLLACLLAFIAVLFSISIFIPTKNEFSGLAQLKSITNPEAGNNEYRLKIWKVTTDMIADYPVTGVGAGNWKLFSANYYQGHDLDSNQLNWIRPHNDVLWVFAEKGIAGILVYLGIFLVTMYYLIAAFFRTKYQKTRLIAMLIAGGLIGYHITSLFSFPLERINQQIYLYFFAASAIVLFLKSKEDDRLETPLKQKVLIAMLISLIFPIVYSIAIIRSDIWLAKARFSLEKEAWKNLMFEVNNAETWARNLDPEANPLNWYKGLAYSGLNDKENALESYHKALQAHPTKITTLHNIAIIYAKLLDYQNAELYFHKALDILPTYYESLEGLATIYAQSGDYQKALQALLKIKPEERTEVTLNNLQASRRLILKELVDDAIQLQETGNETEAWQKLDSATRTFDLPDRFLYFFEKDHASRFDTVTHLKILKLVPADKRSESYQNRILELRSAL